MTDKRTEIAEEIRKHHDFVLTSHARPDGDSIGSQLALALALEQLGKKVRIVNADPVPPAYLFLPAADRIDVGSVCNDRPDSLIVLECNSLERTGVSFPNPPRLVLNIDHHAAAGDFGSLNWVDASSAAVAEMVFDLLRILRVAPSKEMATNLYVGIMTDTGSFRFSATSRKTFEICSELVAQGAEPGEIARQIYMNEPRSKIELLGEVLRTLQIHPGGRLAWISLTRDVLQSVRADDSQTEGLVNFPLSISGIELVAFFREDSREGVRVSLRSKSRLDVSRVAQAFGGGGHSQAAGLSIEGDLSAAYRLVIPALERLLGD